MPLLAAYFIDRFNREFRKRVRGLSPAALALLEQYQWPGNIRELRNAIERAMLLVDRDWLEPADFTTLTRTASPHRVQAARRGRQPRGGRTPAARRRRSSGAGGNQTQAGQLLGINRDQVRYRIEKFGLAAKP